MTRVDDLNRPPDPGEPTIARRRATVYCLAILSVAAAVIHFAVAGEHFQEYWLFGVFMLVVAGLQLSWSIVASLRPSTLLLWSGAVINAGVVAVYIVTRTVGDVVGPTPHAVEPFGFGDGLCTVLEAVVVAGCAWLLLSRADRPVRRRRLVTASAATATVTAVLLSVAPVDGGPEMVMGGSGGSAAASSASGATPAMHMSGLETSRIKLATATPAGDITMPDTSMVMPGMRMASSTPCDAAPTAAQQKAAVSLADTSWKEVRKYQSLAVAKAAGYRPVTPSGAPVVHYLNVAYYRATVLGGPALNIAEPQSLVYANTPKGAVLVAAMYITAPRGATPRPGGCLTQWHVHTNLCLSGTLDVVGAVGPANSACPPGSVNRVTPPMMHIWFVPIPGGPTAIDAPNQQVVQAAEQVPAPANGPA
jgi:hypothetical protein